MQLFKEFIKYVEDFNKINLLKSI